MGVCRMLTNVLESQDKPPLEELSVQNVRSLVEKSREAQMQC